MAVSQLNVLNKEYAQDWPKRAMWNKVNKDNGCLHTMGFSAISITYLVLRPIFILTKEITQCVCE